MYLHRRALQHISLLSGPGPGVHRHPHSPHDPGDRPSAGRPGTEAPRHPGHRRHHPDRAVPEGMFRRRNPGCDPLAGGPEAGYVPDLRRREGRSGRRPPEIRRHPRGPALPGLRLRRAGLHRAVRFCGQAPPAPLLHRRHGRAGPAGGGGMSQASAAYFYQIKTIVRSIIVSKKTLPSQEERQNVLEQVIDHVISTDFTSIENYVDKLRKQNPGISCDRLAKKITSRKAIKNGLVGAATGLGGFTTLIPATLADVASSWRIQVSMAFSIAYVYGHTTDTTDLKTDLFLILAGDSAKEALKRVSIEVSKSMTKKAVEKYITRDMMVKIWKVVGQKIITKAGEKSLLSFIKMVPLIGAPIGFFFDWTSARIVGKVAITYYRG